MNSDLFSVDFVDIQPANVVAGLKPVILKHLDSVAYALGFDPYHGFTLEQARYALVDKISEGGGDVDEYQALLDKTNEFIAQLTYQRRLLKALGLNPADIELYD